MQDTLINALIVTLSLVGAGFIVYRLFNREEMRHMRNCDRLDDTRGGSWYYDRENDRYCDYATDRTVSAKGDEWL